MSAAGRDSALPLGTTPAGSSYATKALHPSDNDTPVQIPDSKNRLVTFLAYQNKYVVRPPADLAAGASWDCDVIVTSDPVCPLVSLVNNSSDGIHWDKNSCASGLPPPARHQYYMNGMIPHDPSIQSVYDIFKDKMNALLGGSACVRELRCAYSGVTAELEAAALADQGTVLAAQYPIEFAKFSSQEVTGQFCFRPLRLVQFGKIALQSEMSGIPTSYTGRAKDGVYMPIKMTSNDLEFKRSDDRRYLHSDYDVMSNSYRNDRIGVTSGTGVENPLMPVMDVTLSAGGASSTACFPQMTTNVGHMCWRSLAGSSAIVLMVRTGFEVTVEPVSIFAPTLKLPVPVDEMAMKSVVMISREMPDAHPASYNSLGALLPVIANIAAEILPKALPLMGSAYREIKSMFGNTVPAEKKVRKVAKGDSAGQAEQAVEQRVLAAKRAVAPATSARRKLTIRRPLHK